jgi:hypothetical protein
MKTYGEVKVCLDTLTSRIQRTEQINASVPLFLEMVSIVLSKAPLQAVPKYEFPTPV